MSSWTSYNGERLETTLFRPVQLAYGQAKRTHAEFAARHGLPARTFEQASAGVSSHGATGFLDRALEAIGTADRELASLQDSMLPIEAGDEALRAGLAAVRDRLSGLTEQAREFVRTLGRSGRVSQPRCRGGRAAARPARAPARRPRGRPRRRRRSSPS